MSKITAKQEVLNFFNSHPNQWFSIDKLYENYIGGKDPGRAIRSINDRERRISGQNYIILRKSPEGNFKEYGLVREEEE